MDGIKPRKEMAGMSGSSGNFGVAPFHAVNGGGSSMRDAGSVKMPHGENAAMLHDEKRAGPPHIARGKGMMPATAHSDHGPHGCGDFGVASLKSVQG